MPKEPLLVTEDDYRVHEAGRKKIFKQEPERATPAFWREKERVEARGAKARERVEAKRFKKAEKEAEEVTEGAATGAVRIATAPLKLLAGIKKIRFKMPKGIRHPDSLINPDTKFLYLPDRPALSPIGRVITNPMELYFAKTPKGVPFGSMAVFAAIKSGFTSDQLGVVTSLTPPQVDRAIAYLKTKGLLEEDYE